MTTMLPGFDATVPLQVNNLSTYQWAAVYIDGRYAERILPASEQAQLPPNLALLPISVVSYDSPTGIMVGSTASEGEADAVTYLAALSARGWQSGQGVSVDFESGCETVTGFANYANAMGAKLRQAGYLHLPYGMTTALDQISELDGEWLTYWRGGTADDGLTRYWRATGPRFAWQWGGSAPNADLDLCSPQFYACLRGAIVPDPVTQTFSNGFTLGGGFYQSWEHNGGLTAFGMPISAEYDTTGFDGKPVRRQWFQRAVGEWRPGQWPANWDVTYVLLASLVEAGVPELGQLMADAKTHLAAFTPAKGRTP